MSTSECPPQELLCCLCSESTEVNKVSFTGSVATGRRIGLCAMKNLKPATLELGGKSPVIVFADAVETEEDLEKTVEWIMVRLFFGSFTHILNTMSYSARKISPPGTVMLPGDLARSISEGS